MIGYGSGVFLFEMYGGFDMCRIDIGHKFREVRMSFLKRHSVGGN